jgi:membrane protease YdiL (CAAX protease family)
MNQSKLFEYASIILLCITAVILIALQIKPLGWILFGVGVLTLLLCRPNFRKDILLIYISLAMLGLTNINTEVSLNHFLVMGSMITFALVVPYLISRYVYKDHLVRYQLRLGRPWNKIEIFYIFFALIVSYFAVPFMLRDSGSYLNWKVEPGFAYLTLFFIGTNSLGIWDELFFVNTILAILRKYLTFKLANIVQAVLFTSFLYELGFRGWAFIVIYFFAMLQGYVFKQTHSLLYIITIHLIVDLVLYLTLIFLHHPDWLPIFIT